LAGLELPFGESWKLPAEGSHRIHHCKLAELAHFTLEDEEFEDIIPSSAVAMISNDHPDGNDDHKSYKASTKSLLTDKLDMVRKEALDGIDQHQVFGDFVELPEWR
jgi:hypothetical protein